MTPTTSAPPRVRSPRRAGVVFWLLVGLAVVCHGCHLGDHDDELSLGGRCKPAVTSSGRGAGEGVPYEPRP